MKKLLLLFVVAILIFTACAKTPNDTTSTPEPQNGTLIKYPEYPEEIIPRDYDYYVKVIQGDKTIEIPVYNKVVASEYFNSSMYNADIHRRFAEFAFADAPVTIEVTVNLPFESATVMPSSKNIGFAVNSNVITYTLDKPQTTMVKLNDNKDTILAIFAEEPEHEIPDQNDPSVLFFEAGYHDIGSLYLESGQTLYLAPGAVVQTRLKINKANDVTICGRGAILESSPTRMPVDDIRYLCDITNSSNININGIKFLDAHTFNITMQGVKDIEISDIKVLSNQISTDGLSWWSRNENVYVHDSFWHISDDVFVVSGGGEGTQLVENCIVGSDYGTFTIANYTGNPITFKDMDVFRSGRMFKCHTEKTLGMPGGEVITENIFAEDVGTASAQFMDLWGYTNVGRTFTIRNFSAPAYNKTSFIFEIAEDVKDAKITIDNLWIGGKPFTSAEGWLIKGLDNGNELIFTENSDETTAKANATNTIKTEAYTPMSLYVAGLRVETSKQPYFEGETLYIPINELLKVLDYENVTLVGDDLYFSDIDGDYKFTAGSMRAIDLYKGCDIPDAPRLVDKTMFVSAETFSCITSLRINYDAVEKRITVDNRPRRAANRNLLRNPGIEEGLTTDWVTRSFTELYLSEDAHSGNYSIKLYKDNNSYENSDANGIYQDVVDILRRFGEGTYKLTAYVKKGEKCTVDEIEIGITRQFAPEGTGQRYTLTDEWQKIEYTYTLSMNPGSFNAAYFYIGYMKGEVKDVLVDDISFEKIT